MFVAGESELMKSLCFGLTLHHCSKVKKKSTFFQEETLMFSSLSVISEAEYTFYTAFQDHQYKVTNSACVIDQRPAGLWG